MPTSGITDAESNSTVIIATSLSVIILVLIIVTIYCFSDHHINIVLNNPKKSRCIGITKLICIGIILFLIQDLLDKYYQDIHSIQTNTVYENVQQTPTPVYETVM